MDGTQTVSVTTTDNVLQELRSGAQCSGSQTDCKESVLQEQGKKRRFRSDEIRAQAQADQNGSAMDKSPHQMPQSTTFPRKNKFGTSVDPRSQKNENFGTEDLHWVSQPTTFPHGIPIITIQPASSSSDIILQRASSSSDSNDICTITAISFETPPEKKPTSRWRRLKKMLLLCCCGICFWCSCIVLRKKCVKRQQTHSDKGQKFFRRLGKKRKGGGQKPPGFKKWKSRVVQDLKTTPSEPVVCCF